MPYFDGLSDRYEQLCRPHSDIISKKIAQKIEQGIGRGVRGEKDYCTILIIGSDIVKFVRSVSTRKYFSAQTRKQIDIGLSIANVAKEDLKDDESPFNIVASLINQSLGRDEAWKAYYTTEMNSVTAQTEDSKIYEKLVAERDIEKMYMQGDYSKACDAMQKFIDEWCKDDPSDRGWYLQQLARYLYKIRKDQSNEVQKAAFKLNPQLLKPREGVTYTKISYINENRTKRIKDYLSRFRDYEELKLSIDATLDNLSFGMESEKFEAALKEIGELLGFISQRPDKEIRKGPDNLWCGVDDQYFVFECKTEVNESRAEIYKEEAGQMNTHCAWFEQEYGKDARFYPFMIIPTKTLSYYANFTHDVCIMRKGKLRQFKRNIKNFINNLSPYKLTDISDETLQRLITLHKLDVNHIQAEYSEPYFHKTK
jgi:hypothetical protein